MHKRILSQLSSDEVAIYCKIPKSVSFVDHPSFKDPSTEQDLFGERAETIEIPIWKGFYPAIEEENIGQIKGRQRGPLSRRKEQILFLRYNYARYRLSRLIETQAKGVSGKRAKQMVLWFQRAQKVRLDIIGANLPMVIARAKGLYPSRLSFSERVSLGNLVLLRCIEKFDVSRKRKFSTYFYLSAYREIAKAEREASKGLQVEPATLEMLSEVIDRQRGGNGSAGYLWFLRSVVEGGKRYNLSQSEIMVIFYRYGFSFRGPRKGESLERIAGRMGLSHQRICQLEKKALEKLRKILLANPDLLYEK